LAKLLVAQKAERAAERVKYQGLLFYTEFRYVIITVLLVVAALILQQTIEDALEYFVRSRFKNKLDRIGWMFLFSFILILLVIAVVMLWKPVKIPPVVTDAPFDPTSVEAIERLLRELMQREQKQT